MRHEQKRGWFQRDTRAMYSRAHARHRLNIPKNSITGISKALYSIKSPWRNKQATRSSSLFTLHCTQTAEQSERARNNKCTRWYPQQHSLAGNKLMSEASVAHGR
eukprot:scpid85663/ scgid11147/ 